MRTKTILLVAISLFSFIGIGACDDDKEISQLNQLVGTWVEQAPYNDGICDTLRFTSAKTVELYTPLQGYTFEVTQKNKISIYNSANRNEFSFTLTENGGNEVLKIFNFMDRSLTANVKNITFVKLK